MRFGDPGHDRVLRTKTWSGAKRLGPHDLVTPVPRFENRVFHLVLGPGQRSLTAGGKKNKFWKVIFMKTHDCEDCVLGMRYKIYLNPSNNFKRLMVAFLLDVNI